MAYDCSVRAVSGGTGGHATEVAPQVIYVATCRTSGGRGNGKELAQRYIHTDSMDRSGHIAGRDTEIFTELLSEHFYVKKRIQIFAREWDDDILVRWLPCHHGMARLQFADGGDALQVWRIAANILNKQSRRADKWLSSSLVVGRGANKSSP
jgi:hypothetical protein